MKRLRAILRSQRGMTLIELMVALVVLTIGVLAVGRVFPAGSRGQLQDRMLTAGNYYAQQQAEELQGRTWSDPDLSVGRHPASGDVALGSSGQWHRFYQVDLLTAPLDNIKRVTVTVNWTFMGSRSVTATIYLRR
jgi:prepilin-type N-terminal cleavage/methylation domain-containing protein